MTAKRRKILTASLIAITAAFVALGAFALSGGLDRTVTQRVHAGETRVVRVALVDAVLGFDVTPDRLVVDRGAHLVLLVANEGDEVHDLALQRGPHTKRLAPGESQRLDIGVLNSGVPRLYCTLPGHRLAGMTLDLEIREGPSALRPATGLRVEPS